MRPGKTVFEWMQDHDVRSLGIDVRRFASFGVIKVRNLLCPQKSANSHIRRRASYVAYIGGQCSSSMKYKPRSNHPLYHHPP